MRHLFDLIDKLWEVNNKLYNKVLPAQLQVVEVTTAKHLLRKMVVIKVEKNKCICLYFQKASEPWPLQYNERLVD